jgi:hypothetical protein
MGKGGISQIAVVFFVLVCALVQPIYAKYSGGTGEPNNPYQIANVADLMALASDVNDYNKCFILTADIDLDPCLPGGRDFNTAVIASDKNKNEAFDGNTFTGVFDGAGYKISNLTIDTNGLKRHYLGLFGDVSGEVKNLCLEDIRITAGVFSRRIGGLEGRNNYGTVSNCFSTGVINEGNELGGLVGENLHGTIKNCFSTAAVTTGPISSNIGGLVGWNNEANISDCYATGAVAITGVTRSDTFGGLVGLNGGRIDNCYSTGNVVGSAYSGGLAGQNKGSIKNCYSTGNVNGRNCSGGLVGYNSSGTISNCYATGVVTGVQGYNFFGGLVGYNYQQSSINNCYSTGTVTVGAGVGGLVGDNYNGTINRSYFLDVAGPNNGYGTPLTDANMKQQASFVGWDFVWESVNGPNDIWAICEGVSYPKLAWQFIPGDSDNNKDVDFVDFAAIGLKWMQVDLTLYCGGMDLTGDEFVDLRDINELVQNWLKGL